MEEEEAMKPIRHEDRQDAAAKAALYTGGYARAVYRNALADVARSAARRYEVSLEALPGLEPPAEDFEVGVLLMGVVESLRPAYRDVLLAKAEYLDDRKAAAAMGLKYNAFKTRLVRARRAAIAAMGGGM